MADGPTLMRDPNGDVHPVQERHVERQKARGWTTEPKRNRSAEQATDPDADPGEPQE